MSRKAECPQCNGSGTYYDDDDLIRCERCGGSGFVPDDDPEIVEERELERRYGKRFYQRESL